MAHFNAELFANIVSEASQPLTLRELASMTGISESTLSRVERRIGVPDVETVYALCAWMQVSPALFLLPPMDEDGSKAVRAALRQIADIAGRFQ